MSRPPEWSSKSNSARRHDGFHPGVLGQLVRTARGISEDRDPGGLRRCLGHRRSPEIPARGRGLAAPDGLRRRPGPARLASTVVRLLEPDREREPRFLHDDDRPPRAVRRARPPLRLHAKDRIHGWDFPEPRHLVRARGVRRSLRSQFDGHRDGDHLRVRVPLAHGHQRHVRPEPMVVGLRHRAALGRVDADRRDPQLSFVRSRWRLPRRVRGTGLSGTGAVPARNMVEQKDDITEERRILKKAGVLDDKLLDKMDIYPGDRVRFRFYYPHSGFEEIVGHFMGFYTLYEGPEGGGDLNLVIRLVKPGRTTVVYKDRNYLEEFEVLEPNLEVRDQIKDLDARHGRHVGTSSAEPQYRSTPCASAWRRAIRSWIGGWVLKMRTNAPPRNGFTMKRLWDAGLPNAIGRRRFSTSSFSSADAKASGCPLAFAPL